MMKSLVLVFALALAAACGGGSSSAVDAVPSSVKVVACGGAAPKATITVVAVGQGFMFSPSTATISVNDVVHIMSTSFHPVASGAGGTPDGKFTVSNGDACLQFTAAGTFPFFCSVHFFTGTITVQ